MRFSEIVLQGVRNFSQTHRFPLGEGVTAFLGGPQSGKTTFVDVLVHLMFPDTAEPATEAFQGPAGPVCRVALLLDDNKGERYRLVKDLTRGSLALTRLDAASGAFAPISNVPAEILQYLSSQLHLPQRDVFEGLFVLRRSDRPSLSAGQFLAAAPPAAIAGPAGQPGRGGGMAAARRGLAVMGGASGAAGTPARKLPPSPHMMGADNGAGGPQFPGYQGADGAGAEQDDEVLPNDPEEIRSQLASLEHDIKVAQSVDELQFKLDGLQSELFEVEQKFKGVTSAEARVRQLEEALRGFENLGQLPGDFEQRVREFESDRGKYERDLVRLDEERERWEKLASGATPEPLTRNRIFMLGLAVALLGLAGGTAGFFLAEWMRYLALLDLLGFGVALVVAFRHLDSIMDVERSQSRLQSIEERRGKLTRQYELETAIVRRTMEQVKVEKPSQILELYSQRAGLQANLAKAQEEVRKQGAQVGLSAMEKHRDELQEQVNRIEGELAGAGGLMMGPIEMQRKIERLKEKLQSLEASKGVLPALSVASPAATASEPAFEASPPGGLDIGSADGFDAGGFDGGVSLGGGAGAGAALNPCQQTIKLALDLFLVDTEKLQATLAIRADQYVQALTNRRYGGLAIAPDGSVGCQDLGAGGMLVPVGSLSLPMQDLVWLGLRLTVIELNSRQQPVPLFLDDPFQGLPPPTLDLVGRMLANLGRSTQVALLTSQQELLAHAAASFQLQ